MHICIPRFQIKRKIFLTSENVNFGCFVKKLYYTYREEREIRYLIRNLDPVTALANPIFLFTLNIFRDTLYK